MYFSLNEKIKDSPLHFSLNVLKAIFTNSEGFLIIDNFILYLMMSHTFSTQLSHGAYFGIDVK